jgi:hypothetical protein
MGGLFGGLAGLGNVGEQFAQAKELNRQRAMSDEEFAQKRQEFQLRQQQLQQELQRNRAIQWSDTPFTTPDGKTVFRGTDPTGKIVWSNPQSVSPLPKAGASKAIGKPVLGSEIKDTATDWRGQPLNPQKNYQPYQMGNQVVYAEADQPSKPEKAFASPGGGPPVGIIRDNKALMPGMSGWTDDDQKFLDKETASFKENQQQKVSDQMKVAQARVNQWLQRPTGVYDSDGNLTFATANQINANPGKYAPAAPALKTKNAEARFNEIATTQAMVNDAIRKLPDDAFDAKSRAQIALVLGAEHPNDAWSNFINSGFATTLTPEQVDYVTTLASLQESAMALTGIQGIGRGSDTLRGAVVNMLPGANTPSKQWAQKQMKIFDAEVKALKTGLPSLPGESSGSAGQVQPKVQHNPKTGAYRYSVDGGRTWQPGQPPKQ